MGLFDRLRPSSGPSPDDVRRQLIDAHARNDLREFASLLHAHFDSVRAAFPGWKTVPAELRAHPEKVETYVRGLMAIASVYEQSGDPSLMQLLRPGRLEWEDHLREANTLIENNRYEEAIAVLQRSLRSLDAVTGTAVAHYRPRLLGVLGMAYFKAGNAALARDATAQALDLCKHAGDEEGVTTYSNNLRAIGTAILPSAAGEPLSVAFYGSDGRVLAESELAGAGYLRYEVNTGGSQISAEAKKLHDRGRATGQQGHTEEAIALFTEAAQLEPTWPYPIYDRAYAQLQRGDFPAALADYRRVLEMSPRGFFTASVAVDILSREATGEFPEGLYRAFSTIEHFPREQQHNILVQSVEKFPTLAAAWSGLANFETDHAKRLDIIEKGLAAKGDVETLGELTVRKAMTLTALGRRDDAVAILEPLVADGTGPIGVRVKAYAALKTLP